ncbi:MAG: phosphomannomutase/phosphoglucomutase [Proteobacteria bacterium]|nr:phosphomannomutase/phosphoglucomutase [Pseudomonadota bacterium]
MSETAKKLEAKHTVHPSILRAYDIRGEVGKTLFEVDAYHIGRAFASHAARQSGNKNPSIAIGYDGRVSSPSMAKAVIQGMVESGAKVINVGLGPTPMLYFATKHWKLDGGIMITGSHNPPSHNGFKMMLQHASIYGDIIQQFGKTMSAGDYTNGQGSEESRSVEKDYINALVQEIAGSPAFDIAWDPGNGAACEIMQGLIKKLPGTNHAINTKIDGTFPSHAPDPTVEKNLEQLKQLVKKHQSGVGIAFDGDGDRIGVVDDKGRMVAGDQLLVILARDVLKAKPGAPIIADVKASKVFFDAVKKDGGKPVMWKTGHSLVKTKMAEEKAPLAGEMSGHIFFADRYYGFDDGLYAAVRLIKILAGHKQTLSQMIDELPKTFTTPEMRIECKEERKFAIVEEIKKRAKASGQQFNDIDGIRVDSAEGWWLIRSSNTQAALSARAEAVSEAALKKLVAHMEAELKTSGIDIHHAADHH